MLRTPWGQEKFLTLSKTPRSTEEVPPERKMRLAQGDGKHNASLDPTDTDDLGQPLARD